MPPQATNVRKNPVLSDLTALSFPLSVKSPFPRNCPDYARRIKIIRKRELSLAWMAPFLLRSLDRCYFLTPFEVAWKYWLLNF